MTITYHEKSLTDLQEAVRYYSEISWKLAAEFEAEFQNYIARIRYNPRSFHFTQNQIYRRANFKQFPYRLIYSFDEESASIRVLTLCHNKRHPCFGMERQ